MFHIKQIELKLKFPVNPYIWLVSNRDLVQAPGKRSGESGKVYPLSKKVEATTKLSSKVISSNQ